MISRVFCHQFKCSAARTSPCFCTMTHIVACVPCAVLYVITITPFFISLPECAHLSPSTCKFLFMFLHLILCCPFSYCIPDVIKCRMMILISYFPALRHGFFHVKTVRFVRWHHSLPTFGSEMALSARMSTPSFAGSPRCAFTLTKKVDCLPLPASYGLLSTMTGCHTNTATALLSACHEAQAKMLPIEADLSCSPLPHVPLCTAAFSFFFFLYSSQVIISCSHFALFV